MRIIAIRTIEGCLEGTNVKDLAFDQKIAKEFIDYLSNFGKLIYQADFEKPFFKIIVRGRFTLKGSEGNSSARVILPDENLDDLLDLLYKICEDFPENNELG